MWLATHSMMAMHKHTLMYPTALFAQLFSFSANDNTTTDETDESCPKTPWIVVVGAYLIPLPAGFLCGVLFMMFRHRSKQKCKATRPYRNMLERNK